MTKRHETSDQSARKPEAERLTTNAANVSVGCKPAAMVTLKG